MQLFPNGVKGLSDSKWAGVIGSAFRLVGLDLHSKPGIIRVAQKLTKHSDTTITELCKSSILCSDNSKLWFSSESGKIWREYNNSYTLVYTNTIQAEPFSTPRYFLNLDASLNQKLTITNAAQTGLDLDNPYTTTVEALVVGGGGGASQGAGSGGGVLYEAAHQIASGLYAITVGSGGTGSDSSNNGTSGGNSQFDNMSANGGGGGGKYHAAGSNGGSGGGGGGTTSSPGSYAGGTGSQQGNNGGASSSNGGNIGGSGGGGGYSAVGSAASTNDGGNGGAGLTSSISGSSVVYGSGGGGRRGASGGSNGTGGTNAGNAADVTGSNATANRGGGGGGGGTGGNGGSGVVIIKYLTGTLSATGGTITTSGSYTIHTFTTSGNFEVIIHSVFTIASYINLRSLPSENNYFSIVEKWNETGNQRSWRFGIYKYNERYYLSQEISFTGAASQLQRIQEITPLLKEWMHVAITFDQLNDAVKFYINGSQVGSTQPASMGSNLFISTAGVGIGGQADNDLNSFNGYLSDIRIWNRILSGANIASLYADPVSFSNGASLVAHWKLNNDGTDESANNNDLTGSSDDGEDLGAENDTIGYIQFGSNVADEKTLDAVEFDGYIYWSSEERLRRIAVSNIGSTWLKKEGNGDGNVETRGIFSKTDDTYHPMIEKNLALFIGDKNIIASVTSNHVFIDETNFNLPITERIVTLHHFDLDILVGTKKIKDGRVLRWDTVSESWSTEDEVPGGVQAFLRDDNYVYAICGDFGNLMFYNGEKLESYKKIPGDYSPSAKLKVNHRAVGMIFNVPVIGVSNNTGNPALEGVYSFGSYSKDYSKILDLTYPISSGEFTGMEIGSIIVDGADMYVSWKGATAAGVDKLDWTAKYASAYIETVQLIPSIIRGKLKTLTDFSAQYASLPTNTDIILKYERNYAGSFTTLTSVKDIKLMQKRAHKSINEIGSLRLRADFTVSSNNAPEVEDFSYFLADTKP